MGLRTLLAMVFVASSIPAFGQGITELFDEARAELMKELGDSLANRPMVIGDGTGGLRGVILPDGRVMTPNGLAAEIQQVMEASTAATAAATPAAGFTVLDDFNRADSGVLGAAANGNTWTEIETGTGTVSIAGNRAALVRIAGADLAGAELVIGNQATFDIRATLNISAGNVDGRLNVNATNSGDGLGMNYGAGSTTFNVFGPMGFSTSPAGAAFTPGVDMTYRLMYDGTTLTGTITQGATTRSHTMTTPNTAGTEVVVSNNGPAGTIQVDDVLMVP